MESPFDGFRWAFRTDIGKRRPRNEDAVGVFPEVGLGLDSDGMGGASAGDLASQWVVEALSGVLSRETVEPQGTRKYVIMEALRTVNGKIRHYLREHGLKAMGATLCACLLDSEHPDRATLCTLGDSRAYRFRSAALERLTSDHTVANEISGGAELRPELGRLLTRAVGVTDTLHPQWTVISLSPGDLLLLCSDGLTSALSDPAIEHVLAQSLPIEAMADTLLSQALTTEAKDNLSFILIEVPQVLPLAACFSDEERAEGEYLGFVVERREH